MKAKIIYVLLLFPLFSLCQEKHYGLTVGVNFGKWIGDDELFAQTLSNEMNLEDGFSGFTFKSLQRTGMSLGLFINFPIKNFFSVQPEISYIQKGALFSGNGSYSYYSDLYTVQTKMVYQFDYTNFVLLANYSFTKNNIRPYLIIGPGIDYLVSSQLKVKVTLDGDSNSQSSEIDLGKKMDANFIFGGGFNFSDQIRLEYRYSQGLTPISKDGGNTSMKLRNSGSTINLVAIF